MDVRFGRPDALYALWGLVPLVLLLARAARLRARARERFLGVAMAAKLSPEPGRARTALRVGLVALAFAAFTLAAARPRFGVTYVQAQERGADIVVLLDVSRSMLSEDVYPNRLERSKAYVRDLLRRVGGDRVGLIAFAGVPVLACPLTTDHGFFRGALDDLDTDSAPRGGTAIGDAIRLALDAMDETPDRDCAILLITDGEDHDSFPREAAAAAAERSVRIFAVGIGDPESGSPIPVTGEGGARQYVQHEGVQVRSALDEPLLKDLAVRTGGAYVPARTGTHDLGQIYADHLAELRRGELSDAKRERRVERFQWFAGAGLALFLIAHLSSPFRRTARRATAAGRRRASVAAAIALALAVPAAPAAFGSATAPAQDEAPPSAQPRAQPPDPAAAARKHNEAVALFESGRIAEAAAAFDEARALDPGFAPGAFGAGAALQQDGKLAEAAERYEDAASSGDAQAAARARYNLGTLRLAEARALLGDAPEQVKGKARDEVLAKLDDAALHFRSALRLDPGNEAARYNLELLRQYAKHVQDAWKRADEQEREQQQPNGPDLAHELLALVERQDALSRELITAASGAAEFARIASAQRTLFEDARGLDERIAEALAPPPPAPPATPPLDPQREQAIAALTSIADRARAAMERAAALLDGADSEAALAVQREAAGALDALWSSVAQFAGMLGRMVKLESGAVDGTRAALVATPAPPDRASLGWDQQRVADFAPLLGATAAQSLQQLERASALRPPPDPSVPPPAPSAPGPEETLKAAMQKALEHAPRIAELASGASRALAADRFADALRDEEEALRLLREIQDLLQDPQSQQGESPQDSPGGQDQGQKPDEPGPGDAGEPEQGEQPQQDEPPKDPGAGGAEANPESDALTEEQVEELMRKALAREREYKERVKELQRAAGTPLPVEKDW